jgi:hypothetical protein
MGEQRDRLTLFGWHLFVGFTILDFAEFCHQLLFQGPLEKG